MQTTKTTIAQRIRKLRRLSKYFTSFDVVRLLARRGLNHGRGAVNSAIDSLVAKRELALIRHGTGRKDSIWTTASRCAALM
jgi:hypothetical protein